MTTRTCKQTERLGRFVGMSDEWAALNGHAYQPSSLPIA